MHKFASNVIEKSLAHSSDSDRCLLVNALLDSDATHLTARQSSDESGPLGPLDRLMRDQFGNYVIQRLLEVCNDEQRDVLLERVRDQLQTLKRFTYGKHIVARMEKLLSTDVASIQLNSSSTATAAHFTEPA
ncbi:Puf protein, partial [Haematococcus lacustris]